MLEIWKRILDLLSAFDKKSQALIFCLFIVIYFQYAYFTGEIKSCKEKINQVEESKNNTEIELKQKIQDCHNAVIFEIKNCNAELMKLINEVNAIKNKLKNDK